MVFSSSLDPVPSARERRGAAAGGPKESRANQQCAQSARQVYCQPQFARLAQFALAHFAMDWINAVAGCRAARSATGPASRTAPNLHVAASASKHGGRYSPSC